ncbi:MAG: DNA-3-methyladenine glycosylase 2 family protein [Bacillaceae bacterium]|nr:DNA-3-methyladenine glycosylase 2 family protein [Bacillaceae bacterium]
MTRTLTFHPEDKQLQTLITSDPQLGKLITTVGPYSLTLQQNYFEELCKKIIGQQLSVRAAGTIWSRVSSLYTNCNPDAIMAVSETDLRKAGVSRPKIVYLRDLAEKVAGGELELEILDQLEDEKVIEVLTGVKGIGRWTAEMFLIFSLGRLNVFSHADVGLQRAVKWLYRTETMEPSLCENWSPYKTMASLYLWEIINRDYIHQYADIDELTGASQRNMRSKF